MKFSSVFLLTAFLSYDLPAEAEQSSRSPRAIGENPATASNPTLRAHNSPLIAVDPTDERFVVLANRVDARDFSCALQMSGDGGRTWVPSNPVPKLPKGAEKCYGPEVAFDRDGVLYYLFVGLKGRGSTPMGVFLAASSDRGGTFSTPRSILGPAVFQVRMAIDHAVGDTGRIHFAWLQARAEPGLGSMPPPPNPIMAAFSDDGGRTLSKPLQVSDRGRERVAGVALAVGPDKAVHVLYYDLEDDARDYHGLEGPTWEGTWSLVMTTSRNGGRRYGEGTVIDGRIVPPERVMLIFTMPPAALAVDEKDGVFVAWPDGRNGDSDVLLSRSTDGGRSWSKPTRLHDDPVKNGRSQHLPRLSVTPDGRVDALFYDRRNDPDNVMNDVYYTYSVDGAKTFRKNLKLNTVPSDSRVGQRYVTPSARDLVEFGGRLGLLSSHDGVLAAWTDTRDKDPFFAKQDIFTTRLVFPTAGEEDGGVPWAAPASGLLVVLFALWMIAARRKRSRLVSVPGADGDLS